jgi:hypothetical protein
MVAIVYLGKVLYSGVIADYVDKEQTISQFLRLISWIFPSFPALLTISFIPTDIMIMLIIVSVFCLLIGIALAKANK